MSARKTNKMVDNGDDDTFLQEFMARAQKRQAKLAQIEEIIKPSENITTEPTGRQDVSYPALSPLPETKEEGIDSPVDSSDETGQHDEDSITEDKTENIQPTMADDLNYSSDLSLECDNEDVYRAEFVHCDSSPEQPQPVVVPNRRQASPKKQAPSAPQIHEEQPAPLQERQPEQKPTSSQSLPAMSKPEQSLNDLQLKVERAEQARAQLKKAVELSKYGSKEHIEAARLLQITEIEHLNFTNQLAMFKEGIRKQTESLGSINISNIRLKMSNKLRNDLAEVGVSHHFFCVATCGMDVKATKIINTNDIRKQDLKAYIQFNEKITFADLPPNFIVKIEIFELVTGQHLPKLLSRLTPSKKTKITPESNFKRVGSLKLTLADRDVCYKNLTQWTKNEESKYIERECKFEMMLKPEQLPCKAGMLHVRCLDNEGRPDWSRFWVDLKDAKIAFWTSKQDSLDGKKENQVLEFKELCSETTQKLTPDDDLYRQNSFVLYSYQLVASGEKDNLFQRVLKDDHKYKIVKHQLATESKEERDSWCSILDRSMHCFREWHGKTKVYTVEQVKEIFSSSY